jgi:hypothetical protein
MVEIEYSWVAPDGTKGYRVGKFLSYRHAWNLLKSWNGWGGGWHYMPSFGVAERHDREVEFKPIDHRSNNPNLA